MPARNFNPKTSRAHAAAFDANQILFQHACATLPDSLARRRLVLQALKIKVHPRHLAYLKICAQLSALDSLADLQSQLQAELQPSACHPHRS